MFFLSMFLEIFKGRDVWPLGSSSIYVWETQGASHGRRAISRWNRTRCPRRKLRLVDGASENSRARRLPNDGSTPASDRSTTITGLEEVERERASGEERDRKRRERGFERAEAAPGPIRLEVRGLQGVATNFGEVLGVEFGAVYGLEVWGCVGSEPRRSLFSEPWRSRLAAWMGGNARLRGFSRASRHELGRG